MYFVTCLRYFKDEKKSYNKVYRNWSFDYLLNARDCATHYEWWEFIWVKILLQHIEEQNIENQPRIGNNPKMISLVHFCTGI